MKKYSIEGAKYQITGLAISSNRMVVESDKAQVLHNIVKACLIQSSCNGVLLRFESTVADGTLLVTGNINNALILFKDNNIIPAEQIDKILSEIQQGISVQTNSVDDHSLQVGTKIQRH